MEIVEAKDGHGEGIEAGCAALETNLLGWMNYRSSKAID
jgi:hypothetical protein